ncbi:MAG: GNAT family N-acetyltransferase [Anaerolinea sp.]|nr:GNAT family N-acetyltransferase [Anaerolinea sp.]
MPDTFIITYLHMTDRAQFKPAYIIDPGMAIKRLEQPTVPFYRFLYDSVGDQLRWRDRRLMTDEELHAAITDPAVSIYVLYVDDEPAGYVELHRLGMDTEIEYFGLIPGNMGRGLGKHLLSFGIEQAWNDGAERVLVDTCNLDSLQALPNYLKRGFEVYDVQSKPMPDRYKT